MMAMATLTLKDTYPPLQLRRPALNMKSICSNIVFYLAVFAILVACTDRAREDLKVVPKEDMALPIQNANTEDFLQNIDPEYPVPKISNIYEGWSFHDEGLLRHVFHEIYEIPFPDTMVNWVAFGNLERDPQGNYDWAGHVVGTIPKDRVATFVETLERTGASFEEGNDEKELGKLYRRLPNRFEGDHQGLAGLDGFIPGSTFKHGFVMRLDRAEISIGFYLDHSTGSLWIRLANDYDHS